MRTRLLILIFLLVASVAYAGMTFTGMIWNLPSTAEYMLMETGTDYILLEDGTSKILLE